MTKSFLSIRDFLWPHLTHSSSGRFTLTVMHISTSPGLIYHSVTLIKFSISSSSDFLSNLLVLLPRIVNSGLSDRGLFAHLSEATAGSLNGVGHSTAYEEVETYS